MSTRIEIPQSALTIETSSSFVAPTKQGPPGYTTYEVLIFCGGFEVARYEYDDSDDNETLWYRGADGGRYLQSEEEALERALTDFGKRLKKALFPEG